MSNMWTEECIPYLFCSTFPTTTHIFLSAQKRPSLLEGFLLRGRIFSQSSISSREQTIKRTILTGDIEMCSSSLWKFHDKKPHKLQSRQRKNKNKYKPKVPKGNKYSLSLSDCSWGPRPRK